MIVFIYMIGYICYPNENLVHKTELLILEKLVRIV